MAWYAIIAAAWFTTIVVRKLPVIHGWTARGVKPWSSDACCSAWFTLVWNAGALRDCGGWGVVQWHQWIGQTAALAAAAYLLLWSWSCLHRAVGWHEDPLPEDFQPPEEFAG